MPKFIQLASLDLIHIHSLQIGSDIQQLDPWKNHESVTDWSPHITNFSDTAHILNQLDLVISVDTAVAHLSAALNRPTWIMLPWDADFRWLLSRSDSPWYPGAVHLYRQPSRGDWQGLSHKIFHSLDDLFMLDLERLALTRLSN